MYTTVHTPVDVRGQLIIVSSFLPWGSRKLNFQGKKVFLLGSHLQPSSVILLDIFYASYCCCSSHSSVILIFPPGKPDQIYSLYCLEVDPKELHFYNASFCCL